MPKPAPMPVNKLNFHTHQPQHYNDQWARDVRECKFKGKCIICGVNTYGFTDGGNDPRGPLGLHAASPLIATEYDATGPDVQLCFGCEQIQIAYKAALKRARALWTPAPAQREITR